MTHDELTETIERIGPIAPGDILVLRGFDDYTTPHEEVIEAICEHYRRIAIARNDPSLPIDAAYHIPLLVFAGPDQAIEHLDEDQMREHGWVRA